MISTPSLIEILIDLKIRFRIERCSHVPRACDIEDATQVEIGRQNSHCQKNKEMIGDYSLMEQFLQ